MKLSAYQKNPVVQSASLVAILLTGYICFNWNEPDKNQLDKTLDSADTAITLSDISQDSFKMYSYFYSQINSDYQKTNNVRRFCSDLLALNNVYPEGAKRARLVNPSLHDEILNNCNGILKK